MPEARKIRTKKKKKYFSGTSEFSFDDLPDMRLDDLSSVDIGGAALDWLAELDDMRVKSGNLQGRQIKVRIFKIKKAIETLTARS